VRPIRLACSRCFGRWRSFSTNNNAAKGWQKIVAGFRAPRLSATRCDDPPLHVGSFVIVGIKGRSPPPAFERGTARYVRSDPNPWQTIQWASKAPLPIIHLFDSTMHPTTLSMAVEFSDGGLAFAGSRYWTLHRPFLDPLTFVRGRSRADTPRANPVSILCRRSVRREILQSANTNLGKVIHMESASAPWGVPAPLLVHCMARLCLSRLSEKMSLALRAGFFFAAPP
jgi:hypothetical protein